MEYQWELFVLDMYILGFSQLVHSGKLYMALIIARSCDEYLTGEYI